MALVDLPTLSLCADSFAQYTPELSPRPGEQRLNRFQFKTTHNSFERENGLADRVSISEQLDRYDVWCIEFDLRWHQANDDFYIFHDCADEAGSDTLNSFLDQINASHRRASGVTFLYLDSGDIGPCFLYPDIVAKPTNWLNRLEAKLQSYFGNAVYTWTEFQADGSRWPSPQELLRRGKHIIPIVNDSEDNEYLFGFTGGTSRIGYVNTDNEDRTIAATNLVDRYLARWYPTGWICVGFNAGWETALNNNFSFPASNCSDMSGSRLHPCQPTYVSAPTEVDRGRGSWLDPFWGANGFKNAINAVASHQVLKGASTITVQSDAGTYSAPSRIAAAVRLTSAGGTTRLHVP